MRGWPKAVFLHGGREGDGMQRRILQAAMVLAALAVLAAAALGLGCASAPAVTVDAGSPACTGASIQAGSDLDEASQYVEVRLAFDAELEAQGDVAADVYVRLNGEVPDAKTVAVSAQVEGSDVVVRLAPTEAATNGKGSYFALYDGQLSVSAAREDGAMAHVRAKGSSSTAVLAGEHAFIVPSGVAIADVAQENGSVSFDMVSFAQLRCCTWLRFADDLPAVRLHNHQFYRDTERTCAERLADTLNITYGQWYSASCDGVRVTVRACDAGHALSVAVVEGEGAVPGDDGGVGAWEGDEQ